MPTVTGEGYGKFCSVSSECAEQSANWSGTAK